MDRITQRSWIVMFYHFLHKIKHLIVTLRFSLLFIFITLFLTTSILIISITSIRFTKTLSSSAIQLMNYVSSSVLREVTIGITPTATQSEFTARLIQQNILNYQEILQNNESGLINYTYYLVKNMPLAMSAYWGDQYGNVVFTCKQPDGIITTDVYLRKTSPATRTTIYRDSEGNIIKRATSPDLGYDPRSRPWYIKAKQAQKTIWTDSYLFHDTRDKGFTVASPVINNNQTTGVFGIDITLGYLSQFLTKQTITPNGYAFIINQEGRLIAYPRRKPFTELKVAPGEFTKVDSVALPIITGSFSAYQKSQEKNLTFIYHNQGQNYLVTYEPIQDLGAYGWLIGVIVPENDFTKDLNRINIITLSISAIILLLGILLVSRLITQIIGPIKLLVKETENIKNFNLDGEIAIKSNIKEILYLRDAIRAMKIGLKLFQRYIPKTLVRQLIESGENIRTGGSRKQLAVFFSDIENFATLSEKTEPNLLMTQLCDYFEALSAIIGSKGGTIDKYIGDSIMAFWGAPLPDKSACIHAAYAALECQTKLNKLNAIWKQQGKPQFNTRIGIHTGEAIVGNLGSSERLNYTAIGDTINIASRLEGINKNYKTNIIVSEAVYEQIKDLFALRLIDCVIVKGRTQTSFLYELLSDDIDNLDFDLNLYRSHFEQGFSAYKQQRWDTALAAFANCLKIYPHDIIAPIFIARCHSFKTNPPGPTWNGVSM